MKKLLGVLVLAIGMCAFAVPPTLGDDHDKDRDRDGCKDRGKRDCDHDRDGDPKGTSVPEPGSMALIASGIVVVGATGLILNRKRKLSN